MYSTPFFAALTALLAVALAVPMPQHEHHAHHRRDLVWTTSTQWDEVTVAITQTVWVEPGQKAAPTETGHAAFAIPNAEPTNHHPQFSVPGQTSQGAPAASMSAPAQVVSAPEHTTQGVSSQSTAYIPPPPPTTTASLVASAATTSPLSVPSFTSSLISNVPAATSVFVAPSPSSTWTAPTSVASSSAPAAAVSPSTSSLPPPSGGGTATFAGFPGDHTIKSISSGAAKPGSEYTGDITYFDTGMGACGWTTKNGDPIVAISQSMFDSYGTANPNANPVCGNAVTITGAGGKTWQAVVVDRCTGCAEGDLDLTQTFFNEVTANTGDGRVHGISWVWN